MSGLQWEKLDWSTAMRLAQNDPEAFERCRRHAIDALIDQASEDQRHRLRCLQWRIDMVRERSANPIAACIGIYRMMWDSFAGDHGLIAAIQRGGAFDPEAPAPAPARAHVLPLTKPQARG
jgi:hypothetical protein